MTRRNIYVSEGDERWWRWAEREAHRIDMSLSRFLVLMLMNGKLGYLYDPTIKPIIEEAV